MTNRHAAQNESTPPEVLAMLSTSPSEEVRLLVAQNPRTPASALAHLARDPGEAIRQAVAANPSAPEETRQLANHYVLGPEAFGLPSAAESAAPPPPAAMPLGTSAESSWESHVPVTPPVPVEAPAKQRPAWIAWFFRLFGK